MDGRAGAAGDTVVGVFDRERLSSALAMVHRAGFGPHARVLDGARGDLVGQLRRAGIRLTLEPRDEDGATALIVVTAPGRGAAAADALARAGARAVHRAGRGGPLPAATTGVVPDARSPGATAFDLGSEPST